MCRSDHYGRRPATSTVRSASDEDREGREAAGLRAIRAATRSQSRHCPRPQGTVRPSLQVSARIGSVLCRRARPSPRCPAIIRFVHPLKPQISDSTSYPRHFADHRQEAFRPAHVSGRRARRPATPRPRLLGTRLAAPASNASAHRSLCGWLPRTATWTWRPSISGVQVHA